MAGIAVLGPALAAAGLLASSAALGKDVCGRPVASYAGIAAALAADPDLKPATNGGPDFIAYADATAPRQWFLTKPGAWPVEAVICRSLESADGRYFVKVETECYGASDLCGRLAASFQQPPS